jgi:hypothetical protein
VTILGKVGGMDSWDVALFAVAGYIAIMSLVRLMLGRRGALAQQIQDDLQRQQMQDEMLKEQNEQNRLAQATLTQSAALAKKKA